MRILLLLSLLFVTLEGITAKETDTLSSNDKIRIYSGFRFGFGGAKQRNTVLRGTDGKFAVNPNMAAVFWVRFREHLGVMVEANYSLKGIKFKNEKKDTISIYQRRIHYVEFPILLHTSIGNSKFTEFVEIGIVPSYIAGLYDQTTKLVDKNPVSTESEDFIYRKGLPYPTKRFDLSLLIGAGLGIKLGPGILHTGFRTNVGLLDIYKDSKRIGYFGENQRQFTFQIQFGYLWHIKSIR